MAEKTSRFADWTPETVTFKDAEGYALVIQDGKLVRKVPWTKQGPVPVVP